jgi:hypothetical protein
VKSTSQYGGTKKVIVLESKRNDHSVGEINNFGLLQYLKIFVAGMGARKNRRAHWAGRPANPGLF